MRVKVFAKLNLTLGVGARRGEFHPIDSVATSMDIYDVVEVVPRSDTQILVNDLPQIAMDHNSAYRAAVAFQAAFSTLGVDIAIEKGIPYGGGLGGSSADAAAVTYCMCKLFGVDEHSDVVHELCAKLGSDVNFMLFGGIGRLQGKGDEVTFSTLAKPLYFALTTFDCSMSSGEVYSAFDKIFDKKPCFPTPYSLFSTPDGEKLIDLLSDGDNGRAIRMLSNDLQQATASISNYADRYLTFVQSNGLRCNMTGSGSAYYVTCETLTEAERIAKLLNSNGFVTTVCKSVSSGIEELH